MRKIRIFFGIATRDNFVEGADMETYLTVEELAEYLKLNKQTIRRWISKQEIPFCKVKNAVRFRLSEIEEWIISDCSLRKTNEQVSNELDLFHDDTGDIA
jgi:excisionase family DNA binding protein